MNLTAANTALVLDSTVDFPEGLQRFPNWRIVPLYVRFGETSYKDYLELSPEEFYEKLRSSPIVPTTSQPTPGDFLAVYEELAPRYERILSLQISSTLSGTFASGESAAEMLGGNAVRVIDSGTVACALALLALAVQRRLERGTTDDEIDALVARFRAEHGLLFTVDTLEYLAKGGRIGRAAALAGTLLNVKPILTVRDGEVVPLKKVRGQQKAFDEFRTIFEAATTDVPSLRVGISHAAAPERLELLRTLALRSRPQAQVDVTSVLGAVVGTHAGPGTVGFSWFDDAE